MRRPSPTPPCRPKPKSRPEAFSSTCTGKAIEHDSRGADGEESAEVIPSAAVAKFFHFRARHAPVFDCITSIHQGSFGLGGNVVACQHARCVRRWKRRTSFPNILLLCFTQYPPFPRFLPMPSAKPCMPIMVRLAWHDAGTFCAKDNTGGANASIRFEPEISHGANAGLTAATQLMQVRECCWHGMYGIWDK